MKSKPACPTTLQSSSFLKAKTMTSIPRWKMSRNWINQRRNSLILKKSRSKPLRATRRKKKSFSKLFRRLKSKNPWRSDSGQARKTRLPRRVMLGPCKRKILKTLKASLSSPTRSLDSRLWFSINRRKMGKLKTAKWLIQ